MRMAWNNCISHIDTSKLLQLERHNISVSSLSCYIKSKLLTTQLFLMYKRAVSDENHCFNSLLLLAHSYISHIITIGEGATNYIKYPSDCYGYDIGSAPNAATIACKTSCDANSNCKAIVFIDGGSQVHLANGAQCYLKNIIPPKCQCMKEVNCYIKTGIYRISGRAI